jgi:DNA polymerase III subunit delta
LKIAARQLPRHLEGPLSGIYLVAGDEPLLVDQAADRIRGAARTQGFNERQVHGVDRSFRWSDLEAGADNLSLFAERRIVELRMASPRPGDAGGRTIKALAESNDPDRLVLISVAAKLDSAASRSAWAKAVEERGVLVTVWPVDRAELPRWIAARATQLELKLSPDAAELLAERVEGNLLAADQELVKLALTAGGKPLDAAAVLDAVQSSARFDVFRLTDAIVAGNAPRTLRILEGLRAEGTQPTLIAWAVSREIALLLRLKFAEDQGQDLGHALSRNGVWRQRQPAVRKAVRRLSRAHLAALMRRAAAVDRTLKGIERGQPWEALTALVMATVAPASSPLARSA